MRTELDMMRGGDWNWQPVVGTYASRKLNGVACLWDGSWGWTRGGNLIELPQRIKDTLPPMPLDCEIISCAGRNFDFIAASVAVRFNRWTPDITAVCFDAPTMPGDWPQRIGAARRAVARCVDWCVVESPKSLFAMLSANISDGFEGVMIRTPQVSYSAGRTTALLKLKSRHLAELSMFQSRKAA